MSLTAQQAARTFAVLYEETSEFFVTLAVGNGKVDGGRNFLFTGMSQLVFANYAECCPPHICELQCQAVCKAQVGETWNQKCLREECTDCDECADLGNEDNGGGDETDEENPCPQDCYDSEVAWKKKSKQ